MMQIELRSLLQGDAGVAALVPGDRINWSQHPQADPATSYVVLTLVSGQEDLTMAGPDGLRRDRVQVDCYGPDYLAAARVADAVRSALHGRRSGGFRLIVLDGVRDLPERQDGGATIYRVSLDFICNWRNDHG